MTILGASTATATTVAVFGAASTAVLGYLGWATTKRRNIDDGAGTLVAAGVALATFETGARHECEAELEKVRAVLEDHRRRLDECDKHRVHDAEVLAMLAAKHGVTIDDIPIGE